jgi:8-oxo-dGTP pyrophosphatase MutT (NUDIX family)
MNPKPAKTPRKPKKPARAPGAERLQIAALPWRLAERLEIMLVSSRETKRWIIPKGWPMAGRSHSAAAAIEAMEEAGLLGTITPEPIGQYRYVKKFARGETAPVKVEVFALRVTRQRESWPEKGERETLWFAADEAMNLVSDPELRDVIAGFIRAQGGSPQG